MKPVNITFLIAAFILLLSIFYAFVIIKNTNQVISKNTKSKKQKFAFNDIEEATKEETAKMQEMMLATFLNILEAQKHAYKKDVSHVKDKKGHYAKNEILSKESIQWKSKSYLDYIPKQYVESLN